MLRNCVVDGEAKATVLGELKSRTVWLVNKKCRPAFRLYSESQISSQSILDITAGKSP